MDRKKLKDLVLRIGDRERKRTEDDLQADVQTLLMWGGLNLDEADVRAITLEAQVGDGTRRRIDIEIGATAIETKKQLRSDKDVEEAATQLAGYVRERIHQTGQRYAGILTDGKTWRLYNVREDGTHVEVSRHDLGQDPDSDRLIVWLEGVIATAHDIKPTPKEVALRLGADSSSYKLDLAILHDLYASRRSHPEIALKRQLWAKSLSTALGTQFTDDDDLFVQHTYLVNVAELIAHAAIGFRIQDPAYTATQLLNGTLFSGGAGAIRGVVEPDFFDWVVDGDADESDTGAQFVRTLARRLARFDWSDVEHDVLKVLYESVIPAGQRHKLGEYYTPDWLASAVVAEAVSDPLNQRVLDPSCGSGTFVFHAVRRYVAAAKAAGREPSATLSGAVNAVFGIDLHPVAVTLARVTFLLALGKDLYSQRGEIGFSVPIYLGDSMQWKQADRRTLFGSTGDVRVDTDDGQSLLYEELVFPASTLDEVSRFDALVGYLADRATDPNRPKNPPHLSDTVLAQYGVPEADRETVRKTFRTMCSLHDEGRNRIWGYYVKNVARPIWLARAENHVDVLVGNPPWLAYRYMSKSMQAAFQQRGDDLAVRPKGKLATHADLAGVFVANAVDVYLKDGGSFAFVMPRNVLQSPHYEQFRTGRFGRAETGTAVNLSESWDLTHVRPHIFPVPACVVFGRQSSEPGRMPREAWSWAGKLPKHNCGWRDAEQCLTRSRVEIATAGTPRSPYHDSFKQGATVTPRMLLLVADSDVGPLGAPAGLRGVRSRRSGDKDPWKSLPDLTGAVEERFLMPLLLGQNVVPFRALDAETAVVPWDRQMLDGSSPKLDSYPGLAKWWRTAEALWDKHANSDMTLGERLDYQHGVVRQFPIARQRVVYTTSGSMIAAARLLDERALVDTSLYWMPTTTDDEALYLVAMLNSTALLDEVTPLQPVGQFGPRHFHRYPLYPPLPKYDASNASHFELAGLAREAEDLIADMTLPQAFVTARREVRAALNDSGIGEKIEDLAAQVLVSKA